MDTITQGLLGVAVAECGFRSRGGRAAFWMGVIGGVLPDLDMVIGLTGRAFGNPWLGWQFHRHFTHSLLFAPLAGLAMAWLWNRFSSYKSFGFWYACAFLVLLTHALLDWCTSYGTMLLAPLSDRRFALDAVPIIDPLYSGLLLAAILVCRWLRRAKAPSATWPVGLAGVLVSTAYLGLGYLQHGRAMDRLAAHAASAGHRVVHARAMPSLGTVFRWRLVYRTDDAFHFGSTNTLLASRSGEFTSVRIPDSRAIRATAEDPRIRMLAWFADGMVLPGEQTVGDMTIVTFQDVRYSQSPGGGDGLWGVVAIMDDAGNIRAMRPFHRGFRRSGETLAATVLRNGGRTRGGT